VGSTVDVNGIPVYYEERGSGPPVLFLHGFGDAVFVWEPLLSRVAGYRLIAMDLKGHGESGKPRDGRYSLRDHAAVVSGLMAALELQDVVVVGQSFGGTVALSGMVRDEALRSRTRALVLIDAPAYPQRMPRFFAILRTPIVRDILRWIVPPAANTRSILRLIYHRRELVTDERVQLAVENGRKPGAQEAQIATAAMIVPPDADALTASYSEIRVPTLILWGDHDRLIPLAIGRTLATQIPNAGLDVIPDSGHNPHEEQPAETARLLTSFLGSLP
jgi:pimeloyl-ACP methyl ester carboxylesterase